MMQTVLTKHWLTVHVGLVLFASWIGLRYLPSTSGFVFLIWLSFLAVEAFALLPTVRKGETLADARLRVARSVFQDPFFYLGLSFAGVALVQWLNSGCSLIYLPDADVWQRSLPPVPWAPFSVEPNGALRSVSVFATCVIGGVILRNSVGRGGKRALLQAAAGLSGCVACYMVWQACQAVEPFAKAAATPGACSYGTFFGFWLVLGMGAYADALARRQRATEVLFALGFVGNLVGALFFASAPMAVIYACVALVIAIYWMVYLRNAVAKVVQLKLFLASVAVFAGTAVALIFIFPDNPVIAKIRSLAEFDSFWAGLSEMRGVRTAAALRLWKEHLWVGTGANGFFHFVGSVVEGKDWVQIKNDQAYVCNDCLQYLCEYGVLGASLLAAIVVCLMVPVCYRARLAWQYGTGEENEGRLFLLRLSPLVVTGVCATALCFVESWLASPFRLPGLLTSWVFVMAMLPSFLPVKGRTRA